ncbi:MAG: HAD-IB family hydrolase [Proteobacteria bacterium]|nr:HAD-IB family hydrolase [Pseudomonadota bacterium]
MFDLDGTLTWHDTLLEYLAGAIRARPSRAWRLGWLPLALARFAVDRDRGRLKGRVVRAVLGGLDRAQVAALTRDFVERRLPGLLRPAALAALARHREAGDRLVLLSASPDCYVPAIGERLGFDEIICTGLRWDGERLDGRLATPNRRGAEKVVCLEALRRRHPGARFAAYGNAASDLPHLALVEAPLLVNASAAAKREAGRREVPTAQW